MAPAIISDADSRWIKYGLLNLYYSILMSLRFFGGWPKEKYWKFITGLLTRDSVIC